MLTFFVIVSYRLKFKMFIKDSSQSSGAPTMNQFRKLLLETQTRLMVKKVVVSKRHRCDQDES
jgi:hypothetical protein